MEFFDVIEKRYSMRGFEDKEVEQEKLDKILKAAQIAPTGVNFQPFKVIVIDTKKYKEELNLSSRMVYTSANCSLCSCFQGKGLDKEIRWQEYCRHRCNHCHDSYDSCS